MVALGFGVLWTGLLDAQINIALLERKTDLVHVKDPVGEKASHGATQ